MPIPLNQCRVIEAIVYGGMSAQGSSVIPTVTTFHYARAAVGVDPDKTAFDTAFQTAIVLPMADCLSVRWTQKWTTIRFIDDAENPPTTFVHTAPGTIAGDSMPAYNYVYMLMRTNLRGKKFRGNKKMGPIAEASTTAPTADLLNAGAIALFATFATAMLTPIVDSTTNSWSQVVLNRPPLSQLKSNPTVLRYNQITQIVTNKRISRLRRREGVPVY